jgi:hypothetical protein
MRVRTYCRVAAIAFAAFTGYPLVTKLAEGRLAHDWAHTALHFVSMLATIYAGWLATTLTAATVLTWLVGIGYTALGVLGWFIDGFLLSSHLAIPLGPVDNIFHLLLGVPALIIALSGRISPTPDGLGQRAG